MNKSVLVIGAGLAGSEAAWYLASRGIKVVLIEAKSKALNPAQKLSSYAELVCTNSLKSKEIDSAHGILKAEMKALGSIILSAAEKHAVPAGMALAVDREAFSLEVTERLKSHPLIQVVEDEVTDPIKAQEHYGCSLVICASGPLTSKPLADWIVANITDQNLYFYDAIAPVVDGDSLDYSKLYYKDRHVESDEEGEEADYLNAPLNKEQYQALITALQQAEKVPAKEFEDYRFFESCLPVDTMAERGMETARFSCMKPVGLELPDGTEPYAAVQLRRENLLGSAFNLVGFQTKLTYSEQLRVFRMIPGLEKAEFIHLGSIHRNTYLNSKELCEKDFSAKRFPNLYFAGQLSGVEGYTESAAMGQYVASQVWRKLHQLPILEYPVESAMGALVNYIFTAPKAVPSNINYGLFPSVPLTKEQRHNRLLRKKFKRLLIAVRAKDSFLQFMGELQRS